MDFFTIILDKTKVKMILKHFNPKHCLHWLINPASIQKIQLCFNKCINPYLVYQQHNRRVKTLQFRPMLDWITKARLMIQFSTSINRYFKIEYKLPNKWKYKNKENFGEISMNSLKSNSFNFLVNSLLWLWSPALKKFIVILNLFKASFRELLKLKITLQKLCHSVEILVSFVRKK